MARKRSSKQPKQGYWEGLIILGAIKYSYRAPKALYKTQEHVAVELQKLYKKVIMDLQKKREIEEQLSSPEWGRWGL
jgi:hypothetical protein